MLLKVQELEVKQEGEGKDSHRFERATVDGWMDVCGGGGSVVEMLLWWMRESASSRI